MIEEARTHWGDRREATGVALVVVLAVGLGLSALVFGRPLSHSAAPDGHRLVGTAHADQLAGGDAPDTILGRGGPDDLQGAGGFDRIKGGRGADVLLGGPGGALLVGGSGRDGFNMENGIQKGGQGHTVIRARDGALDQVNCGPGDHDVAIVDRAEDGVYDCETMKVPNSGQKR
jgi:Ca2+-binding RTX toxin-like protein